VARRQPATNEYKFKPDEPATINEGFNCPCFSVFIRAIAGGGSASDSRGLRRMDALPTRQGFKLTAFPGFFSLARMLHVAEGRIKGPIFHYMKGTILIWRAFWAFLVASVILGLPGAAGAQITPINIGHVNNGGYAQSVAVAGNYAYLANNIDGLRIYDVSNPANPISIGHTNDSANLGAALGVAFYRLRFQ
jgi:hypothetical protein